MTSGGFFSIMAFLYILFLALILLLTIIFQLSSSMCMQFLIYENIFIPISNFAYIEMMNRISLFNQTSQYHVWYISLLYILIIISSCTRRVILGQHQDLTIIQIWSLISFQMSNKVKVPKNYFCFCF